MKNEFLFEISEATKKVAPDYEGVVFKAVKNSDNTGVYDITSSSFEGVEHYQTEEVLHWISMGVWVVTE